jgi:hypothetical protein
VANKFFLFFIPVFIFLFVSIFPIFLSALTMQSTNYRMESDNPLTAGGGAGSTVNYLYESDIGELSTGRIASAGYKIGEGYLSQQNFTISVSSPLDTTMSPDIPGMTGGTADASIIWNVMTDADSGFNMKIKSSASPAMQLGSGYYFDDYVPQSTGVPDYGWSVASNNAEFGFTVEPATDADASQLFRDNNSNTCNTGSYQTSNKCWLNFNGTTNINVINRTVRTSAAGEDETIKFRAQSNGKFLKSGQYTSQVTVTVSAN